MQTFKHMFSRAWTAVTNPGQDERVQVLCAAMQAAFLRDKQQFNLDAVLEPIEHTAKDLQVATRLYYETMLKKYWSAGTPTESQTKMLNWIGRKLQLDTLFTSDRNRSAATVAFGAHLATALADGILTDDELTELNKIAANAECTIAEFVQRSWTAHSVELLQSLLSEALETGQLSPTLWRNTPESAAQLGLHRSQIVSAVRPYAQSFAEHTLTDVRERDKLHPDTEQYLNWMARELELSPEFQLYMQQEIRRVKARMELHDGRVPTMHIPPHLNVTAGELLHLFGAAVLRVEKANRAGEIIVLTYSGVLYLTDNRVIFESPEKPISYPYRSLIAYTATDRRYRMQVKNKPEIEFAFLSPVDNAGLIFTTLMHLHSQRLQPKVDGQQSRHIPRDVTQRVWQRYGGRCAECGSSDYLEYDLIIPHAKGGSNSDANVQLLCRRCNLKKSDMI